MSSVYSNYIKRMRMCANENCKGCTYAYEGLTNTEECKEDLLYDAADALEAADRRIEDLEGALAACRAHRGQLPKEGEWVWDKDGMDFNIGSWRCSCCQERPNTYWQGEKNIKPLRFAGSRFCPNCGARMQTVTDCHTLKEGEHDE